MIELDIKESLKNLTGFNPSPPPLQLNAQEGVTYQCISDPYMYSGLAEPSIIIARFQISIYLINDYSKLLNLQKKIWDSWRKLIHQDLGHTHVEYVERGSFIQGSKLLANNKYQYSYIRDYLFYYKE